MKTCVLFQIKAYAAWWEGLHTFISFAVEDNNKKKILPHAWSNRMASTSHRHKQVLRTARHSFRYYISFATLLQNSSWQCFETPVWVSYVSALVRNDQIPTIASLLLPPFRKLVRLVKLTVMWKSAKRSITKLHTPYWSLSFIYTSSKVLHALFSFGFCLLQTRRQKVCFILIYSFTHYQYLLPPEFQGCGGCIFLDCRRKLENLKGTHADTWWTCNRTAKGKSRIEPVTYLL